MHIGVHLENNYYKNILDALKYTRKIKATALQIFFGNKILTTLREKYDPTEKEIAVIRKYITDHKIKLYIHSILSLNFCSNPNSKRFSWGIDNLIYDMNLCNKLGGIGCILHLGTYKSPKFNYTPEEGINNFILSLQKVLDSVQNNSIIIIETMPARKNILGGTIEKLAEVYNSIKDKIGVKIGERVKICLDTAHIFVSGYDINKIEETKKYFEKFDKLIGLSNLELFHLNDSKKELGSIVNRHAPIGRGFIFENLEGKESLKYIVNLANQNNINIILETDYENFSYEIKYLKSLIISKKLSKDTKKIDIKKLSIKDLSIKIFKKILDYYVNINTDKTQNNTIKYKIPSYQKVIKALEKYNGPIYSSNNIKSIEGIGKGFQNKINIIAQKRTLPLYENIIKDKKLDNTIELKKDLQKIWGFGPVFASKLVLMKEISSINNLIQKKNNKNLGLTNLQKIGLKYYKKLAQKINRNIITEFTDELRKITSKVGITVHNAGSYRMGKSSSGDIDIIITCKDTQNISAIKKDFYDILINKKIIVETLSEGSEKSIHIVKFKGKYYQMDAAIIKEPQLPWYLLYFGSSRDFSKKIRLFASKKGYKLNEKGLFNKINGKRINFYPSEEKEIFDFLDLEYVAPEYR